MFHSSIPNLYTLWYTNIFSSSLNPKNHSKLINHQRCIHRKINPFISIHLRKNLLFSRSICMDSYLNCHKMKCSFLFLKIEIFINYQTLSHYRNRTIWMWISLPRVLCERSGLKEMNDYHFLTGHQELR